MKVIYGIGNLKSTPRDAVVVIGVFDGVHIGHQTLIRRAREKAVKTGGTLVVLTFDPHPVHVLRPDQYKPLITTLEHRLFLLQGLGVDLCLVVPFTKDFSHLSPKEFIEIYLQKYLRPTAVFVGQDFRFGQDREGGIRLFQEIGQSLGFPVHDIEPLSPKGQEDKIGSTAVRELILNGDLEEAACYLGRPVSLMQTVVKGEKRGRKLGYRTANLIPDGVLTPPDGVYAVRVWYRERAYYGMANIGVRPTLRESSPQRVVEVHVFDRDMNMYNETLLVEFIKKIRDEKDFDSLDHLRDQIKKDEDVVRSYFASPAL